MARKPTWEQLYNELLDTYGQRIADAFMEARDDLAAHVDLQRLVAAIEARDLNAAIAALHLDPAAYNRLLDEVQAAYTAGGQGALTALPSRTPDGLALVLRFDGRNVRAESYLRRSGADLVTAIVEDQRVAVRQKLVDGMEAGANPRTTALDIVGRIDRATGKRAGGVLGLTSQQERFVASARAELTNLDANYFTRARRDKRFDRTIRKAIDAGEPVPAETIRKATIAYERRLVQLRGEVIGRTESLRALNAGQQEALRQAVDSGQLQASQIRRVWRSASDSRVRDTHRALNGDTAGLEETFRSPSGAMLRFPGDPQAPVSETANCRCWLQPRIDWAANVR